MSDYQFDPAAAEIDARRKEYEAAVERLRQATASATRVQVPYRDAAVSEDEKRRVLDAHIAAGEDAERRRDWLNSAVSRHPANEYLGIVRDASSVRAPKLSGRQWWSQNPSLLEAVPRSDDERDRNAQLAYTLKRVHEAANSRQPGDAFRWDRYRGEYSNEMAGLEALAAQAYGIPNTDLKPNAEVQRQLESPYEYRKWFRDDSGDLLPAAEIPLEALRPLSAAFGGLTRFHDNFISGGSAASEGRVGDAVKSFAYAVPNLVSPSFHRGGSGTETDWRGYVEPGEAFAIDMAAEIPMWLWRGLYPGKRAAGLVPIGAEGRIRQYRDELLTPAFHRAARRHHPDVGGTTEVMQKINAARAAGDLESLERLAR